MHFEEENSDIPQEKNRVIPPRRFVAVTAEEMRSDLVEEDPSGPSQDIHKFRTTISDTMEKPHPKPHPKEVEPPKPGPYKLPEGQSFSRPRSISKAEKPVEEKPKPAPAPLRSKPEPTFGDFLSKVKKDIKQEEPPEVKERRGEVINIFKTSSNIQDFVEERGKKQVVLKLKSR